MRKILVIFFIPIFLVPFIFKKSQWIHLGEDVYINPTTFKVQDGTSSAVFKTKNIEEIQKTNMANLDISYEIIEWSSTCGKSTNISMRSIKLYDSTNNMLGEAEGASGEFSNFVNGAIYYNTLCQKKS